MAGIKYAMNHCLSNSLSMSYALCMGIFPGEGGYQWHFIFRQIDRQSQ